MLDGTSAAADLEKPLLSKGSPNSSRKSNGSPHKAIVILFAGSIGAGVLTLPYGVSCVGVLPAVALFALAALASFQTNVILFRCVYKTGLGTYGDLMVGILGSRGTMVLELFIFLEGLGTIVAYLVFLMNYVPQICALGGEGLWCTDRFNVLVATCLVVWPLSCFRGLSVLQYTSALSMAAIALTSVLVISKAPRCFAQTGSELLPAVSQVRLNRNAFQVLTMGCYAFMVQTQAPEIALLLRSPSRATISRIIGKSSAYLWAVYSAIAVCGFLSFLDATSADFLAGYGVHDHAMQLCRCMMSVTLLCACPLQMLPSMQSLFNIFERLFPGPEGTRRLPLYDKDSIRVPVTTGCFAMIFLVALRAPGIADCISGLGAFLAAPLMFAFPALMYRHILGQRDVALPAMLLLLTAVLWLAEVVRLLS